MLDSENDQPAYGLSPVWLIGLRGSPVVNGFNPGGGDLHVQSGVLNNAAACAGRPSAWSIAALFGRWHGGVLGIHL